MILKYHNPISLLKFIRNLGSPRTNRLGSSCVQNSCNKISINHIDNNQFIRSNKQNGITKRHTSFFDLQHKPILYKLSKK